MTAAAFHADSESREDSVLPLSLFLPTEVQVTSVIAVGCARATVNVIGPAETLDGLERNLRFWADLKIRSRGEEPRINDRAMERVGRDTSVFLADTRTLPSGWVRHAFICDPHCVGDLEYLAQHEIKDVIARLTLDGLAVEAAVILERTLVAMTDRTLAAFPDSGTLTGIIRRDKGALDNAADMVLQHLPGRVVHLDIRNGRGIVAEAECLCADGIEATVVVRNAGHHTVSVEVDGVASTMTSSWPALRPVALTSLGVRHRDVLAEFAAPGRDY